MILPAKENICAVVITYNPDHLLEKQIQSIAKQVKEIIIVDNNSSDQSLLTGIIDQFPSTTIINNKENKGIAAALNTGIESAIEKGYKWILQLDQDSVPEHDLVAELCRCILLYNNDKLAMAGCNYYMGKKSLRNPASGTYSEVLTLITSGSMLSGEVFKIAGRYREEFFIDAVDFEYSLRLKKQGFHSIITEKPLMHHSIGALRTVNLGVFKLQSTNHNPTRRYYRAKNTMLLTKKYFSTFPLWIIKYNFFLVISAFLILLLEKERISKLKAILKGIKDGLSK